MSASFRAGCGRRQPGPDDERDLAYTALAFPECPVCEHRIDPQGAPSFCRWLRADAAHPFAELAALAELL